MNVSHIKSNSKVFFGVKCSNNGYNTAYQTTGINGNEPDMFILNALNTLKTKPSETDVLDIGAGDGRNSIPIAKQGYNVTAKEICPEGRKQIKAQAESNGLNNVTISKNNILSRLVLDLQKYHFIFMSHVSQHLNLSEMNTVLNNVYKKLKPDGIFIFDALIRNSNAEDFNSSQNYEIAGSAHFKLSDLIDAAKSKGFNILGVFNYNETKEGHASYINTATWGGNSSNEYNFPLTLKWIVLKKPESK